MLRAEDLMIGDWVKTVCPKEESYQRVSDINSSDYPYIITAGSEEKWFLVEVEPISLTPEILEKNGLKEDNKYGYGYWYIERLGGYIGQTVSSTTPIEIGYDNGHCVVSNPHIGRVYQGDIEYVHQLQHALKLCGINLEIKI